MPPVTPLPHVRCPLCGGDNECAPAQSGRFDDGCWCTSVTIPAELLAQVPAADRDRACICQRCVQRQAARYSVQ